LRAAGVGHLPFGKHAAAANRRKSMLRIYDDILDWIEAITPLIRQIARHDPNLATQLERASTSVALNTGEGMFGRGKRRVDVAHRRRYIEPLAPRPAVSTKHDEAMRTSDTDSVAQNARNVGQRVAWFTTLAENRTPPATLARPPASECSGAS
jgi:hypothetical protein